MAVDTPNLQYDAMAEAGSWELCKALLGGTPAMRAAGESYLPKEPDEKDKNYEIRVERSFLHNAYDETIEKYVARPFSRPTTWDVVGHPEAKEAIKDVMDDMDGEGLHHQNFAMDFLREMLRWGVASAYVDYPEVDNPDDTNKAEEQDKELRPINRVLETPKVIGWKTTEKANGVEKLVQIRIKETLIEDAADWEQIAYDQIRVIDLDKWTLYRKEKKNKKDISANKKEEWEEVNTGTIQINHKTPDFMPIVTAYTKKTGLMTAKPAFWNMAWTNQELWQSCSDQKNILRFDRLGILFGSGWTPEEVKAGVTVAPTAASLHENPEADLKRIETNGQPAENGWKDIRDIMERLEIQGMEPMIQRLANVKAAGINANEDKSRSQIETWIDTINIAMRQTMQLDLLWMGFDVPFEDIQYSINQDFVFAIKTSQEVKDVIEMRKNGDLSLVDFVKEMQRYGRIADGDVNELAARAREDEAAEIEIFKKTTPPGKPGEKAIGNAIEDEIEIGAEI